MKENEKHEKELVVQGVIKFITLMGERKTAEFIIDLQCSVDGLSKNNRDFANAFREKCRGDKNEH